MTCSFLQTARASVVKATFESTREIVMINMRPSCLHNPYLWTPNTEVREVFNKDILAHFRADEIRVMSKTDPIILFMGQ